MASAVCLTIVSVMPQWNLFQLFQPMGGVRARPLSRAGAGAAASASRPTVTAARPRDLEGVAKMDMGASGEDRVPRSPRKTKLDTGFLVSEDRPVGAAR